MVSSRKNSVIINMSSICSRGNKGQAAYSAAKGGLNSLTFALAKELGSFGIRVVAVAPGYFDTASTHESVSTEHLRTVISSVPLRRLGKLDELWSTIQFVIANKYVTGTVIEVDGGLAL
jgi:3-oxoacyl-[acyl-carrier protein] reductase